MKKPNMMRAAGLGIGLAGAMVIRSFGRTYGDVASMIDERRAEDELDANMGLPLGRTPSCNRPNLRGATAISHLANR